MTKERSDSHRKPVHAPLSNSYSSGASSLTSSFYGVKTVRIFKNGDLYHQGTRMVLNRRYVRDLDHMLSMISEKFDLPYGAKRLYTVDGKLIRHFDEIEDKQDYVASSGQFTPLSYGTWTNPVGYPFRGVSPVNMPHTRVSRSQTRNEVKPSVMRRSQSGLTTASTASEKSLKSRRSPMQSQIPPVRSATAEERKKKKVVKKKKKPPEALLPTSESKDEKIIEVKQQMNKEEDKQRDDKDSQEDEKEEVSKEVIIPEKEETPQDGAISPTSEADDNKSEANADNDERSRTPTASERSATEDEVHHSHHEGHSDGIESEQGDSPLPDRGSTPKTEEKKVSKAEESEKES